MPADIPESSVAATYVMSHPLVSRNIVVTCGHSLQDWTGTMQEAANRLHDDFAEAIVPGLDSNATFLYVDMFVGNGSNPSGSVRSTKPPVVGGFSGNTPPANVAVLVRKVTGVLTRSGRGRMFLPFFVAESAVDEGGFIDADVLQDINAQFELWQTANAREGAAGNGPVPAVINPSPRPGGGLTTSIQITGFAVQNQVATQRRRLRR